MNTNLEEAPVDDRLAVKYVFQRPKVRYVDYDHKIYRIHADGSVVQADFSHEQHHSVSNDPQHKENEHKFHLLSVTRGKLLHLS